MSPSLSVIVVIAASFIGAFLVTPSADPVLFLIRWAIVSIIAVSAYFLGTRKRGQS
jgi:hypothetical protein